MTHDELMAKAMQPANVPCNGCRACCKQDRIVLKEAEASAFRWHFEGGQKVLDRKENGECVYLTPEGCAVHAAPPDVCRRFDCRVLFLLTPKDKRRIRIEQNPTMKDVYEAGKKRLSTLDE